MIHLHIGQNRKLKMHNKLLEQLELIEDINLPIRVASTQLSSEYRDKNYWVTDMKYTQETFILRGTPSKVSADIYETPSEVMSVGVVMTVEELVDFLRKHSYDYPKASNVKLEFDGVSNDRYYGICDAFTIPTVELNDDNVVIYGWVANEKANALFDKQAKMYIPYSWLSKDRLINLLEKEDSVK